MYSNHLGNHSSKGRSLVKLDFLSLPTCVLVLVTLLLLRHGSGQRLGLVQPVPVPGTKLLGEPNACLLELSELLADKLVNVVSRLDRLYQTVDLLRVDGRAMFSPGQAC